MNHRMLKTFTLIMLSFALLLSMTACGQTTATTTAAPAAGETTAAPAATTAAPAEDVYIAVVSKGFQHQFWQTVPLMPRRSTMSKSPLTDRPRNQTSTSISTCSTPPWQRTP